MAHIHDEQTERLLTAPPAVMRLAMILLGFAVFAGANMILNPRQSEAGLRPQPQPAASPDVAGQATPWSSGAAASFSSAADQASGSSAQPLADQPGTFATRTIAQASPRSEALIGTLIGANYIVSIYSTADGPRYSVASTSGVLLAELLSPTQVLAQFPDLPIEDLRLLPSVDRPGPIMIAEPDDQ